MKAVKRILRYLKGMLHYGIKFLKQSTLSLYGFCDADWAGCPTTRWSTIGYYIYLGANCISWSSKKQPTVSRSSSEAEYRALASTTAELVWIMFLLRDIGIKLHEAPQLSSDNKSALYMTINPVFHACSKHIEIDYHFVREKVAIGAFTTWYVPFSHQIADILTKPLSKLPFITFWSKLGVHSIIPSSLKKGERNHDSTAPSINNKEDPTTTSINSTTVGSPSMESNKILANIMKCAAISLGINQTRFIPYS